MNNLRETPLKIVFGLIIVLSFAVGCQTGKANLTAAMPRETELPGWSFARPPQSIGGKNIDIIDPAFRKSGAVEYSDALYRSVSDSEREISVQVVEFDTAINAYGKFSMDRGFCNEGDMNSQFEYIRDSGIYLLYGKFYILIKSNQEEEADLLMQIADLIKNKLPPPQENNNPLPDYINAVPGNINNCDLIFYTVKGMLVPDVKYYFARQKKYGKTSRIIIFYKTDSMESAYNSYYQQALKKGNFTTIRTEPNPAAFSRNQSGLLLITVYRNWFLGVFNTDSLKETDAVLQSVIKNIKEFESAAR